MAFAASRLSLPHVAAGPLARLQGLSSNEDWSEIEDLLASPAPAYKARRQRSRRHAVPLFVSTVAASAVFAGVLVAALGGLPGRCLRLDRCGTPAAPIATASDSLVAMPETVAAKPVAVAPTNRVADAGRSQPDAVSPSIEQGRSVSETSPDAAASVEDAQAAKAPRHHERHHHHHWRP